MKRHQPERTCVACRSKKPKRMLLRIVRTVGERLELDVAANKPGRGAYVCPDEKCVFLAQKKRSFCRSLKVEADNGLFEKILEHIHAEK